ncbi:MAG: AI-2E family transporter [Parvibaculaceae bacterium]
MTAQPTPAPQRPTGKIFPSSGLPYLDLVSFGLAAVALYAVLALGLLPAFLSGVLVYELIHVVAPIVRSRGYSHRTGKIAALIFLSFAFVLLITAATFGLSSMLTDSSDNVVILMRKMAEIVQTAKSYMPVWVHEYIPASAEDWQTQASQWLRANAGALQGLGENFGRLIFHVVVGAVVGGLAAMGPAAALPSSLPPLRGALLSRAQLLGTSFRRVVFAQVRISALNTILTGIYLQIVLPLIGIHVPFVKTMIVITFVVGLLPVIGNLISNTVIVVVSLGVSAYAAVGSLTFLIIIHKLEYFFNARIIGSQISSRAWELLIAMLVMEAWFGIPGIIAAPIYYAYIKTELAERGLI